MKAEEAIQLLIDSIIKRVPVSISVGAVKELDKEQRTCTVEREGRPELTNVRLNSVISDHSDHFTVFPKIGSYVLCVMIDEPGNCYLLATSEPEEIAFKIGSSELVAGKDEILFNTGKLGGLVKIDELVDWMGNVYSDLQTLKTQLSTHPVAGNGAVLGLNFMPGTPNPKKETFENKKIKQ